MRHDLVHILGLLDHERLCELVVCHRACRLLSLDDLGKLRRGVGLVVVLIFLTHIEASPYCIKF